MDEFECAKCKTPDPVIEWIAMSVGGCYGITGQRPCQVSPEHFHCTCRRCGYTWSSLDVPSARGWRK